MRMRAAGQRKSVASILVNPGTTPYTIGERALGWVDENTERRGPFFLNWYTPGALIPTALRDYRERSKHMQSGELRSMYVALASEPS
jgi:hypothetical protein